MHLPGTAMDCKAAFRRRFAFIDDVDPDAFRAASDFMTSGQLAEDLVRPIDEGSHPLPELADRYDLRDLVDQYFDKMIKREALTEKSAARVLELALHSNANSSRDLAAAFLASHPTSTLHSGAFFTLSPEAAFVVLSRDDLRLSPPRFGARHYHEREVLRLVDLWVEKNAAQVEKAGLLVKAVRLELFSFADLTSFQYELGSLQALGPVRAQLTSATASTLKRRLALPLPADDGLAEPLRKRKRTLLADPVTEEIQRKILRATLDLCGAVFPALDAATGAETERSL
ncbi:unnamed protein product [Polarella glacialis]|uniref:BACK domain-containing protein n=1 Tax=Polarella glacialis TaxID=89957 RepID=A0A813HRX1_POLGL|nr:unnamed protein product [Polarella glacialis]